MDKISTASLRISLESLLLSSVSLGEFGLGGLLNFSGCNDWSDGRPGMFDSDGIDWPGDGKPAAGFWPVNRFTNRGTIALKLLNSMPSNCINCCVNTMPPLTVWALTMGCAAAIAPCDCGCDCGNGTPNTNGAKITENTIQEISFIFTSARRFVSFGMEYIDFYISSPILSIALSISLFVVGNFPFSWNKLTKSGIGRQLS